jgi:glutamate synthase (NADPH) large chain
LLKTMIEQHAQLTHSARAKQILADWTAWRGKFVKVFPIEYKRALTELAAKNNKLAA